MREHIRDLGHNPSKYHQIEGDGDFDFEISGESFYQDTLNRICGGKTPEGHERYCVAYLVPEPDNPYDKNAVAVYIENLKVGHIPKTIARRMSEALAGRYATIDAVIVGGWSRARDEGHYGVKLNM